jgi:hypothetical protein
MISTKESLSAKLKRIEKIIPYFYQDTVLFAVEASDDAMVYDSLCRVAKTNGQISCNQKWSFLSPILFFDLGKSKGLFTLEDTKSLINDYRGCDFVLDFVSNTQDRPHCWGIIDQDLYQIDPTKGKYPRLIYTDACDFESSLICSNPDILVDVFSRFSLTKTDLQSQKGLQAFENAYRLGHIKWSLTGIRKLFSSSDIEKLIPSFFAISFSKDEYFLARCLDSNGSLCVSLWLKQSCLSLEASSQSYFDSATLVEIEKQINSSTASLPDHYLMNDQWLLSAPSIQSACSLNTPYNARLLFWRYCNGHDLACFLSVAFSQESLNTNFSSVLAHIFISNASYCSAFSLTSFGQKLIQVIG